MRALVFTGPGVVEMWDVPEPEPGPGDVLVHVVASGICGSELHGVKTPGFRVPPLVMGHEFAGRTEDGAPVIVNPILSCGHCDLCALGTRNVCRQRRIIGVHTPGGFAERVAVPAGALTPLPEGLGWTAAGIVEPAANAVHAWALAGAPAGARVGVIGAGAIGLACLQVALSGGAASVEIADRSDSRRAIAGRLGAAAAVPQLTGEYDVVFDAVGAAATHEQSLARLRPGGAAVWLGLADSTAGFDAADLVRGEKRVLGSFAYRDDDFAAAVDLVGGWDLSWVDTFPLAEGAEIFTTLMNGRATPVKALLTP
ncbi:2-desacetyl-2-hydroxyethyl bacteriochlorophyllide A dehydrogenase [Streptosporangium canum]|uniref:2-desacetyl-2-hydroxyethyl bacteriochlorophyllide A dehydrogenase n=1 Tax=Streptosporangium canum TaxID=324952 RepID=A0A1I3R6H5_9ACTN|nr:alcohol dehydrogenase catalytic domain-containing protein [Streptosporangium canum]SFJ40856.1 2-desacetyl-2-hydroxyethyl bacteriochlorophyllide A dehydrogenase [Streptosporangium canum]